MGGGAGVSPTAGSAGSTVIAGSAGSGGAPGGGGVSGAGTSGVGGSAVAGTGGGDPVACSITAMASTSTRIPTVGIVTWSTDLAGVTAARIEFGLDTNYGMTAPVSLAEPSYRTLLLGMKASRQYHYRIVAQAGTSVCTGPDSTIMTGPLTNDLPNIDVMTMNASALAGGSFITGQYVQGGGASGAPAYILDAEGDIVWWYAPGRDVTGARMSYDGKYMWTNSANVPSSQGANVHRVTMDGLTDENLSSDFTGQSHQLTVLPDETIAFYAYGSNGCDDIKERAPNGTVPTIINARTAQGSTGDCWVNAIEYSPMDDSLVFSDRNHNNYTKVTRAGQVVWVLGGSTSDFTGNGTSLLAQHGVDVLGLDRLLVFNNNVGMGSTSGGSLAIEILLDLGAMSATRAWTYAAMPGIANQVMGDVQRLWNGNTIVAYSTQGVVHEVSPSGELLQELNWPIGGAFGYITKRQSLYGPPPR